MVFESMFDNPFFVNLWIHMSISYTLWCVCQSSCLNLFLNCFLLSATATHDICMTLTVHQKKQFPCHDFIRNMLVIIHPKRDFVSNWYSLWLRMRLILHRFPQHIQGNWTGIHSLRIIFADDQLKYHGRKHKNAESI